MHRLACSPQKSSLYLRNRLYSVDLLIVVNFAHRKTTVRSVFLASTMLASVTSTVLQSSLRLNLSQSDLTLISLFASYQAIATLMTNLASSD